MVRTVKAPEKGNLVIGPVKDVHPEVKKDEYPKRLKPERERKQGEKPERAFLGPGRIKGKKAGEKRRNDNDINDPKRKIVGSVLDPSFSSSKKWKEGFEGINKG